MALPESLRPFFWDCCFEDLDGERDRDFVISRILVSGSWAAIRWVRQNYGDAAIHDWIMRRRGRGLSSRQLRLWELLLELPEADVAEWLSTPEIGRAHV